jgi:hypothetical protein
MNVLKGCLRMTKKDLFSKKFEDMKQADFDELKNIGIKVEYLKASDRYNPYKSPCYEVTLNLFRMYVFCNCWDPKECINHVIDNAQSNFKKRLERLEYNEDWKIPLQ